MTKVKKVVPSILTEEPKALEAMIREAEDFTDYVQLDILDGRFVHKAGQHSQGCKDMG